MTKEINIIRPYTITPVSKAVGVVGTWAFLTPVTILIAAALGASCLWLGARMEDGPDATNWLNIAWWLVQLALVIVLFFGALAALIAGFFFGTFLQESWLRWAARFNENQHRKRQKAEKAREDAKREREAKTPAVGEVLPPVPMPTGKLPVGRSAWD